MSLFEYANADYYKHIHELKYKYKTYSFNEYCGLKSGTKPSPQLGGSPISHNLSKMTNSNYEYYQHEKIYVQSKKLQPIAEGHQFPYDKNETCDLFRLELNEEEMALNISLDTYENVEEIAISIGGALFERIDSRIFSALRKIYNMNRFDIPLQMCKYGLPFLEHHTTEIVVKYKNGTNNENTLNYDICQINKSDIDGFFIILQTDKQKMDENRMITYTYNGLPIQFLLVEDKMNSDLTIDFLSPLGDTTNFKPLYLCTVDGIRIYTFTRSMMFMDIVQYNIDLYEIDHLVINSDSNNKFDVWTIKTNLLMRMAGMAALRYCN